MLQGFFNYDNPVWRFIGKLGDLILLNILWIVCSIPVFTIGASTTAVYYVTLKLVRDEGDSTIRSFFHSFKGNFRQATAIWMILLAAGIVLGLSLIHILRNVQGYVRKAQGHVWKAQGYVRNAQGYMRKAQGYIYQTAGHTHWTKP